MIAHRVAELQRVTRQLEDELAEVEDYPGEDRRDAAAALSDVAVRLELARLAILEGEGPEVGS